MKNKFYFGLFLVLTVTSCLEEAKGNSEKDRVAETEITAQTAESSSPHQLKLNGGEKWKISRGMQKPLEKINDIVLKFKGTKVVDYQLLGDDLGKQTSKVIRKCDMKGTAHDELHKWLLPFLDLKEAMVMTSSPEEGAAILEHIKTELIVFNTYFE